MRPETIIAIGTLLALLCLWGALRAGRKRRLIDNIPTIKTTGVFIGLVELKGSAESEQPLRSYLAEVPCVHYTWNVEEHWSRTVTETYTDSNGKTQTRTRHESGWTTVASGGETQTFYLRDDCGVIRINPERAKIEPVLAFSKTCGRSNPLYYERGPAGAVAHSDHERRFVEHAVPLHAPLYVIGEAREREDIVAPEIAYAPHVPLFLISTRTEQQVSASYGGQYWVLALLGLVLSVVAWPISDHLFARETVLPSFSIGSMNNVTFLPATGYPDLASRWPVYFAIGAAYVFVWLLGWTWMAYNGLVELRQRVRQAWANVDVQLKRRSDLIPNLVRVIEGLRDHERQVQTELATLRSQLNATAPGQPGPDPGGCAAHVQAVIEKYPELKANDAFMNLQRNLVDTEQRIALARGYFNEITTFYNSRLEIVPDRFVAALGHLQPQPLISAEDFERAAPELKLAA